MSRHLFTNRCQWIAVTGLLWGFVGVIAPMPARANVPLTRADVESLHNRVEVMLRGQPARTATLSDWLGVGDSLRTAASSRADLRFNDGSLTRVGERATFRFDPNTRNFRLSNGTVLFLIPPGRGPSTIQTPGATTGIQGTALVVRHIPFADNEDFDPSSNWTPGQIPNTLAECYITTQPAEATSSETLPPAIEGCSDVAGLSRAEMEMPPGRTIVMVLTDNPNGPVEVTTSDGQTEALSAGYMAVIEANTIQVLEFDLALFYETSPLVEGLYLDDPAFEGSNSPTDPVRKETLDGLATQQDFVGGYLLNPDILNSQSQLSPTTNWLVPVAASENGSSGEGLASGQDRINANRLPGPMSSGIVSNPGETPGTNVPPGVLNPGSPGPTMPQPNPNPINPPGPVTPQPDPNPINPPGPVTPQPDPNPINSPGPVTPQPDPTPINPPGNVTPQPGVDVINQPVQVTPDVNFEQLAPVDVATPDPTPNNTPADVNTAAPNDINPPGVIQPDPNIQ
ncbi:MAG: hypothetical protein F6K42_10965 [Leptolyngbya sp. SIO1D8]|nr:hypothetical protein [Leptolyngbya sp. SIO1D8]